MKSDVLASDDLRDDIDEVLDPGDTRLPIEIIYKKLLMCLMVLMIDFKQ